MTEGFDLCHDLLIAENTYSRLGRSHVFVKNWFETFDYNFHSQIVVTVELLPGVDMVYLQDPILSINHLFLQG